MDFVSLVPHWLDAFLIAPYRWLENPVAGIWLGTAFLSAYAVVLGVFTGSLLFWLNRKYYISMQDKMVDAHNLSVAALQAQDKESYTAINKTAHEYFGKTFFAQAAVGMASLWPAPFALAWLSQRFEGIPIHKVLWTERTVGYVFVFISLYIVVRCLFARLKKYLPFFKTVEKIQHDARESRGRLKSLFRGN